MRKIFIDTVDKNEIDRKKARGYKKLVIEAKSNSDIYFETQNNELYIKETEENKDDKEFCYVILCNEFGLVGLNKNFKSRVKVVLLDNGYMLLTLQDGVLLTVEDTIKMYSTVEIVPQIVENKDGTTNILWVDTNYLLSYLKKEEITKDKSNFVYDMEFSLELGGEVENKGIFESEEKFEINHIEEEDIDISLGQFAKYVSNKSNIISEKSIEIDEE